MKSDSRSRRWFRLCCSKGERSDVLSLLHNEGFEFADFSGDTEIMCFTSGGNPPGGSLTNYFGLIYIQDISSMLPAMLLNPEPGAAVLDMCASPGSKAGQLAQMVGSNGLVVANEPNRTRLATLRANIRRLNLTNVVTTGYLGQNFPDRNISFDYILLDVPCSGWGTVDKNPEVLKIWSQDKTGSLVGLQRILLKSAASLLAPGGRLVYSTCTTNEQENQEQINWALQELPLQIPSGKNLLPQEIAQCSQEIFSGMFKVMGRRLGGQDFFMAALESTKADQDGQRPIPMKKNRAEQVAFTNDMRQLTHGRLWNFSGKVFFVPERAWEFIGAGVNAAGLHAGKRSRNNFLVWPGMRAFLPGKDCGTYYAVRDVSELRSLINGQSLSVTGESRMIGLYWNDLGLGWVKIRKNRLFWSDR
ncbi:RsmB/NOP family class I SAM-dependent RNA methyltransferase [Desulfonatronovibrio magnus]|uniref:RsmB/NOP family class I SAM-dependent RNA methyltransferase n=1 Tax=Desulfonatronovibrio magnus TaxID=698827 RepID=UPI0005EAEE79|nr:RsmB/NOP family class I SAM-dependent RNA methyltransferase [Desulfonatronovibrio magnus]